jgi:hypothetical protein
MKFNKKTFILSLVMLTTTFVLVAITSSRAMALGNTFPTDTNIVAVVSKAGSTGDPETPYVSLSAEKAFYLIYIPVSWTNATVTINNFCWDKDYDTKDYKWGGLAYAKLGFYKMSLPYNELNFEGATTANPMSGWTRSNQCGLGNYTYNISGAVLSGIPASTVTGHTNFRVISLEVDKTDSSGNTASPSPGINGFTITVPDADPIDNPLNNPYIVFKPTSPADSGDSLAFPFSSNGFALLDKRLNNYYGSIYDYTKTADSKFIFTFGTGCESGIGPSGADVYLKWSDADYWDNSSLYPGNQRDNGIHFILWDITNGWSNATRVDLMLHGKGTPITDVGGENLMISASSWPAKVVYDNNVRSYAKFTAYNDHKYAWVWENVENDNGVQIWLPYNEINYLLQCPTGNTTVTPSSSPESSMEQGEPAALIHQILPSGVTGSPTVTYQIKRETFTYPVAPTASPSGSATCVQGIDNSCNPVTKTISNNNPITVSTAANSSFAVNAPTGSYICEYLVLGSPSAGVTIGSPNPSRVCVHIIARPIVDFNGLDVDFCTNPTNPAVPVGSVRTWAKLKDGAYVGSSSQYALFIYNTISGDGVADRKGFFTGATTAVTNPKQLTFANTVGGVFGGDWGNTTTCKDYFGDEYGSSGAGITTIEGDYPINSSVQIQPGQNLTVYVHGNAYINNNITYNTATAWTSGNIPSYRLIVSGNIYISSGVNFLDGFYFAGGNIYTCTSGASATFPGYGTCTGPLIVTGAFEALGSIKYWRTGGTLNLATPAETFTFSPEMFLSRWMGSGSDLFSNEVQSIRSMPPVF